MSLQTRVSQRIWLPQRGHEAPVFFVKFDFYAVPLSAEFFRARHIARETSRVCDICLGTFHLGDVVVSVRNNNVLFPNSMLHDACVQWDDVTVTATALRDSWNDAQQYRHWFVN